MPTTDSIMDAASIFGHALPNLSPFILSASSNFAHQTVQRVDIGVWVQHRRALLLATNLNDAAKTVQASAKGVGLEAGGEKILDGGFGEEATILLRSGRVEIRLPALGSVGYVFNW